jgi:hypothetical protein
LLHFRPFNLINRFIDRAVRTFEVCGACPHAAIVLTLAGEEVQACEWMHRDMGTFTSSIGKVSAQPSLSEER